MNHPDPKKHQ